MPIIEKVLAEIETQIKQGMIIINRVNSRHLNADEHLLVASLKQLDRVSIGSSATA